MDASDGLWSSRRMRALIAARNVGGAIKLARQARAWRQADLGAATGYSASTISRLESGRRTTADVEMLRSVAAAVGMPAEVLGVLLGIGELPRVTVTRYGPPKEEDPVRRRALLAAAGLAVPVRLLSAIDDAFVTMPRLPGTVGVADVTSLFLRARREFDAGDMTRLVGSLPALLAAAHAVAKEGQEPVAFAQLAACYDLTTETLVKVGRYPASRIAADRSLAYAELSGSPMAKAASARCLSIVLRHEGRQSMADRITVEAATLLEQTGLVTPAQTAAYAQPLCTCAYNAAQAGDRDRSLEMISEAGRAAERLEPATVPGQPFSISTAHVSLYKIGVHWALGDAGAALNSGAGLRPGMFRTPERKGRLHTDMARAWWQWGKPEQTAHALLAALQVAPAEVLGRPAIRGMATELTRRYPRVSGARELTAALRT
jgi:transcriptional regulator with XRE-family HTH domain